MKSFHTSRQARRTFIKRSAMAGMTLPFIPEMSFEQPVVREPSQEGIQVSIFSKHLQFLNYEGMASVAAELGFDGVELTVRNGGHVDPNQVEEQLPAAIEAVKKNGLDSSMMVSGVTELNELSRRVLTTAADLGVQYYRLGYYGFPEEGSMPEALASFNEAVKTLAEFGSSIGIVGCYQNHAGGLVGASMWEIWQLLQGAKPGIMGCQYDIRHAMVEGGYSWRNGLRLIKDRITTLAIKDYRWEKVDGEWEVLNTPIGEGMVDFTGFFRIIKDYGINVPMALHYEYDLYGVEHGGRKVAKADQPKVLEAFRKDLVNLRTFWAEA